MGRVKDHCQGKEFTQMQMLDTPKFDRRRLEIEQIPSEWEKAQNGKKSKCFGAVERCRKGHCRRFTGRIDRRGSGQENKGRVEAGPR